jgi:hypothetical protein
MIKFIVIGIIVAFNIILADNFLIKYQEENYTFKVSYSEVVVETNNVVRFRGHTDKNGRIMINIEPGHYTCKVNYRRRWMRADITIDHSNYLKIIYLKNE